MDTRQQQIIALSVVAIGLLGVFLYFQTRNTLTINEAHEISEKYIDSLNLPDIEIDEIMEFEQNFYVVFSEHSTGIGAFEMLIDKDNGRIFPEYGPNMMWNAKYGHGGFMHGSTTGPVQVDEEEALQIAQSFLDEVYPGSEADDPHPFYGYYTIHTTKDGQIFGMLSVNQYDGQVWYHNWHGDYIRSLETH